MFMYRLFFQFYCQCRDVNPMLSMFYSECNPSKQFYFPIIGCSELNKTRIELHCSILEKSSAPFSLGGQNLKRYFDQR